MNEVQSIIDKMTLEEKASIVSGKMIWYINGVERLNIPKIMMSDGPSGLRKQASKENIAESVKAVCYPASALTASSFDENKLHKLGEYLGHASRNEDVNILLGPGVNIKRTPLNGRNFEYFSEDPLLAGKLGAAYVNGVQSTGVGVSLKHFAANNRENTRFTASSNMDQRALREVYLKPFEYVVKHAHPTTIMCSYNAINGTLNSQNKELLTHILRDEWGYQGVVMSDWGAVADHIAALNAGLDLEMPGKGQLSIDEIIEGVQNEEISEATLNRSVYRILKLINEVTANEVDESVSLEEQHQFAVKLAAESMVLLKNNNQVLPVKEDDKLLVLGELATNPHYQGGGSSHVNMFSMSTPLEIISQHMNVEYEQGYSNTPKSCKETEKLIQQALSKAENAEKIIIFAGTTEQSESEGFDRKTLSIPDEQNQLIFALAKLNKPIIVVLQNGSAIEMPWVNEVSGILETYFPGEAVGEATWDVLSGAVNPSGKLPETFPISLKDTSSYGTFNNSDVEENYHESIFVGYKYFDIKEKEVLFPFGYGLSYTTFKYSNLKCVDQGDTLNVQLDIQNTGNVAGSEVPQVYIHNKATKVETVPKILADFKTVTLKPNEKKTVSLVVRKETLEWFNESKSGWQFDNGAYEVLVGSSSRDTQLRENVQLIWHPKHVNVIDRDTYLSTIIENEQLFNLFKQSKFYSGLMQVFKDNDDALLKMMRYTPLRSAVMMGTYTTMSVVDDFVDEANHTLG